MLSIWKSKKGVNDISIALVIMGIFIFIGVLLPYINSGFGSGHSINQSTDDILQGTSDTLASQSTVGVVTILFSIGKMFLWTFGDLPFWLDAFFLLLRLGLAFIIARNIWVGGGG